MENQNKLDSIDKNRRKFLTVMLLGSGAFVAEKILTPLLSKFLNDSPQKPTASIKTDLGGFKVTENKKVLSVFDSSGEEIFQIDKEA